LCFNDTTLLRCRITDNESRDSAGGGIYFYYSGYAKNCLIDGNRARAGGGVYCRDGGVVDNCTIVGNSATYDGGGIYRNGGGTFRNSIIYDNTAATDPNYDGTTGGYTYCCTTPDPGDSGNITSDPLFIDAAAGNWRIGYGSPCIDAGTNGTVQSSTDLDGNARIVNSIVDMGAYEYDGEIYDSDGDRSTDSDEYTADTDPTDGNDWFHIASISNSAVFFDSSASRWYTLLACTNLVEGVWTNVPGTPPRIGVGGADSMQSTNNLPEEFYKLEVALP
ncbi:MAG: hypothetical protein KAU94_06825, partial [Verrucomicrobia bacterium]|nr:hypothetical protein [Verrucomicrobiota bacterium]